jgi:hypothetical protein
VSDLPPEPEPHPEPTPEPQEEPAESLADDGTPGTGAEFEEEEDDPKTS